MYFAIASAIIAVACSAITIKTLVGYSDIRRSRKIIVGLLVVVGWFAPLLVGLVRDSGLFGPEAFAVVSKILYLMFGTVFILFSMLLFPSSALTRKSASSSMRWSMPSTGSTVW